VIVFLAWRTGGGLKGPTPEAALPVQVHAPVFLGPDFCSIPALIPPSFALALGGSSRRCISSGLTVAQPAWVLLQGLWGAQSDENVPALAVVR
jgi:hypothetical protein